MRHEVVGAEHKAQCPQLVAKVASNESDQALDVGDGGHRGKGEEFADLSRFWVLTWKSVGEWHLFGKALIALCKPREHNLRALGMAGVIEKRLPTDGQRFVHKFW